MLVFLLFKIVAKTKKKCEFPFKVKKFEWLVHRRTVACSSVKVCTMLSRQAPSPQPPSPLPCISTLVIFLLIHRRATFTTPLYMLAPLCQTQWFHVAHKSHWPESKTYLPSKKAGVKWLLETFFVPHFGLHISICILYRKGFWWKSLDHWEPLCADHSLSEYFFCFLVYRIQDILLTMWHNIQKRKKFLRLLYTILLTSFCSTLYNT